MAEISAGELRAVAPPPAWRKRRWLLLTVVVALAALLGLLYWGMLKGPSAPVGVMVPLNNKPAPVFSVPATDGQPLTLSDLRGKIVILNVWASWCIPCRDEAGELNRAYGVYKGRDVVFIGIAWNDDEREVQKFMDQYKVPYRVALDPEGQIAIDLGITGVPETFLIDAQGQLVQKWVGPITAAQVGRMLAPLVP